MKNAARLYFTRGETNTWLTPLPFVEALGLFDLCPASPAVRPWSYAAKHYTAEDDGLAQPWEGRVWLNPPYERGLVDAFARKMVEHDRGTMIVFTRVDTAWFQLAAGRCSAMLLKAGRIAFCREDGIPAKKFLGSVFFAFGRYDAGRLARASEDSPLFKGVLFRRV